MTKKLISGILIIGSLTFAGLLIFDAGQSVYENRQSEIAGAPQSQKSENIESLSYRRQPGINNNTEELAKKISEEIVALNPEGPQEIQGESWLNASEPKDLANKLFEEGIANFDIESLRPDVKVTNFKITPNDPLATQEYLRNLKKILAGLANPPQNGTPSLADLNNLFLSYQKIIPELYQLKVPTDIALIHRQGGVALETQKNILEKLLRAEEDPVTAILAAQLLPIINDEVKDFEKKIEELTKS